MAGKVYRKDQLGEQRTALDRNRRKIYATQTVCALCGQPVDMSLRYPHPMSKTVDHIIPIARGGHPSDLANLQLAHLACNLAKSDSIAPPCPKRARTVSNRNLPQSRDWANFKTGGGA